MDLVFRAPSTAQVSWALMDDEHRGVLELCQDIARDRALGWLEESVAEIRWGSGGKHRAPVKDGLIVAVFRHYESRARRADQLPADSGRRALADVVLLDAEGRLSATIEGTMCCVQDRARLVRALYERLDRLTAVPVDRTV